MPKAQLEAVPQSTGLATEAIDAALRLCGAIQSLVRELLCEGQFLINEFDLLDHDDIPSSELPAGSVTALAYRSTNSIFWTIARAKDALLGRGQGQLLTAVKSLVRKLLAELHVFNRFDLLDHVGIPLCYCR